MLTVKERKKQDNKHEQRWIQKKLLFLFDFLKERYFFHFHVNKNDLVPSKKFRIGMKIISGINSIRGLGGMKIKEKLEELDKTLTGTGNIIFLAGGSQAGNMSW